ncbi:hypothetical protein LTR95_007250 [Oleoguttula sp. CCFEE 5521]
MSWKRKIRPLTPFFIRLVVITPAAFRLRSLHDVQLSTDPNFDSIGSIVFTQAELACSLVTATVSCLLAFVRGWNTGFGALNPDTVQAQSRQDSIKAGGSHELSAIHHRNTRRSHISVSLSAVAEESTHKWSINTSRGKPAEKRSIASDDSTGMMIRKTTETRIHTEARNTTLSKV